MLYFAYGSCMDSQDFKRTCPTARKVSKNAILDGYRLAFDGYSAHRRGGVANIRRSKKGRVHGVVWDIQDRREIAALDRREGAPYVYARRMVKVWFRGRYELVLTYELCDPYPYEMRPSDDYARIVLAGIADPDYYDTIQNHIMSLPVIGKGEMEDVGRITAYRGWNVRDSLEEKFLDTVARR